MTWRCLFFTGPPNCIKILTPTDSLHLAEVAPCNHFPYKWGTVWKLFFVPFATITIIPGNAPTSTNASLSITVIKSRTSSDHAIRKTQQYQFQHLISKLNTPAYHMINSNPHSQLLSNQLFDQGKRISLLSQVAMLSYVTSGNQASHYHSSN